MEKRRRYHKRTNKKDRKLTLQNHAKERIESKQNKNVCPFPHGVNILLNPVMQVMDHFFRPCVSTQPAALEFQNRLKSLENAKN